MKTYKELMEEAESFDKKDKAMAKDAIKDLTTIKHAIDASIKDLKKTTCHQHLPHKAQVGFDTSLNNLA